MTRMEVYGCIRVRDGCIRMHTDAYGCIPYDLYIRYILCVLTYCTFYTVHMYIYIYILDILYILYILYKLYKVRIPHDLYMLHIP